MTPGARVAAAIEVLDAHRSGTALEKALTNWGRASRFAGSKDRAAVRDLVFDAVRRQRSCGGLDAQVPTRVWVAAVLKATGCAPDAMFTGDGHAPAPLLPAELDHLAELPAAVPDAPDWMVADLRRDLGADGASRVVDSLAHRAPLGLRVNLRKADVAKAQQALLRDGIETQTTPVVPTALIVKTNPRRVHSSRAFQDGWVEIQDAHSQAIAARVPLSPGDRVLDYCAGGGGKTLALAARADGVWHVHDAAPQRLADIPDRAKRAGVKVQAVTRDDAATQAPFDAVICDVPCSGSGAWRRSPAAKWRTAPGDIAAFQALQRDICAAALPLVRPGGIFAYFTCSVLAAENAAQKDWLLDHAPTLRVLDEAQYLPDGVGDGFYALIVRKD